MPAASRTASPGRPAARTDATAPAGPAGAKDDLRWLGFLDLGLIVLALPVFLLAGFPLAGWATATGAWLVQRGIQALIHRRASASNDLRTVVGLTVFGQITRAWISAIAVFAVGLGVSSAAGLSAIVLILLLFTTYFATSMLMRLPGPEATPR
jgi:hypothetical protein